MIYTLTANPALDYVINVDNLKLGDINRTDSEYIYAGGKGINVSTVLQNLGVKSIALGFVAGSTGVMLLDMLKKQGLESRMVEVTRGMTRINAKIFSSGATETAINGSGPDISADEIESLYKILKELKAGDIIVLSGSVPNSIKRGTEGQQSFYGEICSRLANDGVEFIVDATGELLLDTLKYSPLLIKPNNYELGEIFDCEIDNKETAAIYARKLIEKGAQNVMVSMAEQGAVLVDSTGKAYFCEAPDIRVVNSVGAGDTTVAAFIAKYIQSTTGVDYDDLLRFAVAAGSATASMSELASKNEIYELYDKIKFC